MLKTSSLHAAERLDDVAFSDIVQIRNKVIELRAAGRAVHAFHGGEPFFPTPDAVKSAMTQALADNKTNYAPSSGIPPLLAALQAKLRRRNHIEATTDQIIVTVGGMQALYAAFQATLDPGDEALLFSPYWSPIRDLITGAQARPVFVGTDAARRDGLARTLEGLRTGRTRLIYFNTPQNPSGAVFTRAEAEEIAAFALKHDLLVIADEAYEDLVYTGEHFSIASLPGMFERTITTYTFSKSFGMTGWRVGYAVAGEPFMTALRKIVLYSTNGVSTPSQWAALRALELPQQWIDDRREDYRRRRDLLVAGLNQLGLNCPLPAGAFYAFPDVSAIDPDSRRAAAIMIDKAQVAAIPGCVFGPHGEGHVRFGYAVPIEAIPPALEALRVLLKN